jgi:hypothetical protein
VAATRCWAERYPVLGAGTGSLPAHCTVSEGSSSRNRDGGLYAGCPQLVRTVAREMNSRCCARVIPT